MPGAVGMRYGAAVERLSPSKIVDVVRFRAMVTPGIVQGLWLLATALVLLGGGYLVVAPAGAELRRLYGETLMVTATVLAALLVRIWCETMVILFAIHRELGALLRRRADG